MSTGFIGAWNSHFHRINWMDRNTVNMQSVNCYLLDASQFLICVRCHVPLCYWGLGEGKMIIGSDPCKLLAELLSPEEGGGCGVRALVLAG